MLSGTKGTATQCVCIIYGKMQEAGCPQDNQTKMRTRYDKRYG